MTAKPRLKLIDDEPVRAIHVSYRGGRAFVENVRLISTRAVKPPVPRGHRQFVGKVEWR